MTTEKSTTEKGKAITHGIGTFVGGVLLLASLGVDIIVLRSDLRKFDQFINERKEK
jgi:hypothetical protein